MVLYHCLLQKEAVKTISLPKMGVEKRYACLGRQQAQQGKALGGRDGTMGSGEMGHLAVAPIRIIDYIRILAEKTRAKGQIFHLREPSLPRQED